jgi:hypothetical protein
MNALQIVRRRIRRIIGSSKHHRESSPAASPIAPNVAEFLDQIGASLVWCASCGDPLAGIAYSDDDGEHAEVISLACIRNGCGAVPVIVGVLEGRPSTTH